MKEIKKQKNVDFLAHYVYPLPAGTPYYAQDLKDEDTVELIFDYCQILLAYITLKGWELLIDYHGYEKLYEIDKRSGWYDCDTIEEYKQWVQYEKDLAKKCGL